MLHTTGYRVKHAKSTKISRLESKIVCSLSFNHLAVRMYVMGEHDRTFTIPLRSSHVNSSNGSYLKLAGLLEASTPTHEGRVSSSEKVLDFFAGHPLISPIYANLAGMPPMLLQAGECELLVDDTKAFVQKYRLQNRRSERSKIRAEEYTDMVHDFQAMHFLAESKHAIENISAFIKRLFGQEVDQVIDEKLVKLF